MLRDPILRGFFSVALIEAFGAPGLNVACLVPLLIDEM